MMNMALSFGASLLSIYLLLCVFLYLYQERLIFMPPRANATLYENWQPYAYQLPINGSTLHGWKISQPLASDNYLIYFGGNAEDVVYNLYDAHKYSARHMFFTNYAGYGNSTGEPSEQALYTDAIALFDKIISDNNLHTGKVIVMGRSLGAAVASYVASQRAVKALVLITPFDSVEQVAASYYRWFPVSWLLKHKFKTIEHIQQVSSPILIVAAEHDEIIPRRNLNNLYQSAQDKIKLVTIANANHQNISNISDYYTRINQFMDAQDTAQ